MDFFYRVKDWTKHFENSESRRYKSLTWLPMKNKHDGKGYRRLAAHAKSVQVFAAWNLIAQVASKMPTRGDLIDDDGPLTASDLSAKTGFPESIFESAFVVLTDPKIGWLEKVHWPSGAGPPADSRSSPEVAQQNPANRLTLNRTELRQSDKASGGGSVDAQGHRRQSDKATKLASSQKWLVQELEGLLDGQWVNDAGKWVSRAKSAEGKVERIVAELRSAVREDRINTTPAQYAEHLWTEFA